MSYFARLCAYYCYRNLPSNERETSADILNSLFSCQFSSLPAHFFLSDMFWWYPHVATSDYLMCLQNANVSQNTVDFCRKPIKSVCLPQIFLYEEWWRFCHSLFRLLRSSNKLYTMAKLDSLPHVLVNKLFTNDLFDAVQTHIICINKAMTSIRHCIPKLEATCRSADVRVIKTIRLELDTIESVRSKVGNLKIIHLVRDPRAMLNSRRTWISVLRADLKTACVRLKEDLQQFGRLQQLKAAKNYLQVRYEDLIQHPYRVSKSMYNHIGIDPPEMLSPWLHNHTAAKVDNDSAGSVRKNSLLHINSWKNSKNLTSLFELSKNISECLYVLHMMKWV